MVVEVLLYNQASLEIQAIQAIHQVNKVKTKLCQGNQHSLGNQVTHQQLSSSVVEAAEAALETK